MVWLFNIHIAIILKYSMENPWDCLQVFILILKLLLLLSDFLIHNLRKIWARFFYKIMEDIYLESLCQFVWWTKYHVFLRFRAFLFSLLGYRKDCAKIFQPSVHFFLTERYCKNIGRIWSFFPTCVLFILLHLIAKCFSALSQCGTYDTRVVTFPGEQSAYLARWACNVTLVTQSIDAH